MIGNYLKVAFRNIIRQKAYSFITILSLTVGLTASLLIFYFLFQELSYDNFHEKKDNIVRVGAVTIRKEVDERKENSVTHMPLAKAMEDRLPEVISTVRVYKPYAHYIKIGEDFYKDYQFLIVDPTFFSIFTFPIVETSDTLPLSKPNTAYVTESAALKYFGTGSPLGKTFLYNKETEFLITGVVADPPVNSHLQFEFLGSFSSVTGETFRISPESWNIIANNHTYALVAPGTDLTAMQQKVTSLLEEFCGTEWSFAFEGIVHPLESIHVFNSLHDDLGVNFSESSLLIIGTLGFFILLLAIINFINLATARSAKREKEVGLRKVIGASRFHLINRFIGEAIFITLIAALFAVMSAELLLPFFSDLVSAKVVSPFADYPLLIPALLAGAILIGIAAGLYPGLFLSRARSVTALRGMEKGGKTSNPLVRKTLVILQFSISVILIIGTFTVTEQLNYMRTADLGFKEDNIITFRNFTGSYETGKEEVSKIPGVKDVCGNFGAPISGNTFWTFMYVDGFDGDDNFRIYANSVDDNFIDMFDIKLLAGRNFDERRGTDKEFAVIINEEAVKKLGFTNPEDVIGKSYDFGLNDTLATVIGVMKNFHFGSLKEYIEPMALMHVKSLIRYLSVEVNAANTASVLESISGLWNKNITDEPFKYEFLDEFAYNLYQEEERTSQIVGTFAVVAIILGCLGLFGLSAFSAEQRRKEIGIRKVLGASVPSLVTMLSGEFLTLVVISVIIAVPVSYYFMGEWLSEFAYRITISPFTFIGAGLTALLIALITVSYQAVKAASANPVKSIHYE